ncbi:hypothetical protein FF38_09369 [Lucilia cuprina]|uniref:Uncharacterized protein n=1 Tax=Lucilia cuprina TaxID=7375 RepID=A0A0L0CQE2_LUCCU|nr:hypothetical protein FF38_09369 [Lucilia cuprina]
MDANAATAESFVKIFSKLFCRYYNFSYTMLRRKKSVESFAKKRERERERQVTVREKLQKL